MSTPSDSNSEGSAWAPAAWTDLGNAGSQTLSTGLKGKVAMYFPYQFKDTSYRHGRLFLNTPWVEGLLPLHPVCHPRPMGLLQSPSFHRLLPFKG